MGSRGDMKMSKGKTIEAFINQKIRTEEAGYHLQLETERIVINNFITLEMCLIMTLYIDII